MDNDYDADEFPNYTDPLAPMQVTAAHEYNHVLQYGYDALQDTWMFESTATWAEDKVFDGSQRLRLLPAVVGAGARRADHVRGRRRPRRAPTT